MLFSSDLKEVMQVAVTHTEGEPRQQHLHIGGGVSRELLRLFQSYVNVYQEDILAIKRSTRGNANLVIIMTDKVKDGEMASEIADKLIDRVRGFIERQERQEQARRTGNGFAIHSDVKAFHGHGD